MSHGGQQQQGGPQLSFGSATMDQNGNLQRLLQQTPQLDQASGPTKPGLFGNALGQAAQTYASQPAGGGGLSVPNPTSDPNLQATMQGLQGLFAQAKANKQAMAKMFMGA